MSAMTKSIEFIYDLASPNAYLANKALTKLAANHDATITYTPVLLGGIFKATGNRAPMVAFAPVPAKLQYMMVEMRRFIAKHGCTAFKMNPHFPLNTLALSRAAVAAQMDGDLEAFIAAGEALVWEEGLKMDDPDIFVKAFTEKGLDGARLLARTQDQDVKDALAKTTQSAVDRGAFGIPTFFVGEEMFFGKDSLGDLEDALTA